jgi:hypothetical protein
MKQMVFLCVARAIQLDCKWARLYERLVPKKCSFDERTRRYRGKVKVMGCIAGQMIDGQWHESGTARETGAGGCHLELGGCNARRGLS